MDLTTAGQPAASSSRRAVVVTLALTAAAIAVLFAAVPHGLYGDGYVRYLKIDALLREGTLGPERYSYVGPLFAAPFWLFGDTRMWWCARFNVLVLAVAVFAGWRALRPLLPVDERAAFVLLLAATGMMPHATRDFYGEVFSAVLVGTGFMLVNGTRSRIGWAAVALGVVNAPATAVGLLLAALWRTWKDRRADGLIAFAVAAGLIVLENTIVRGGAFDTGYHGDRGLVTVLPYSGMRGFSYPLLFGLASLLFSFGKGLLFFAPGVLLVADARRRRPDLATCLDLSIAFLAGLLLVYSQWWAWYGGWTWGPRFLLFAIYPSSLAIAIALTAPAAWPRSAVALAVTWWTVWVGVSGAAFGVDGLDECLANGYALEYLCWYVPEYSPVLRPLVIRPESLAGWQQVWMVLAAVVAGVLTTSGPALSSAADRLASAMRRTP